jgi:hypothetical protein
MAFDRAKWKPANLATNKETSNEAEKLTKSKYENNRPGFHSIEDGTNIFRICPPHEENDPSFQPVCVSKIPLEVDETDKDGKVTTVLDSDNKPVYDEVKLGA